MAGLLQGGTDLTDFAADERFRTTQGRYDHSDEINAVLRPLLATQPFAHWSERLAAERIMHEQLNSYTGFLEQPHVAESGAIAWLNHPHVPKPLPMPQVIGAPPFVDGSVLATIARAWPAHRGYSARARLWRERDRGACGTRGCYAGTELTGASLCLSRRHAYCHCGLRTVSRATTELVPVWARWDRDMISRSNRPSDCTQGATVPLQRDISIASRVKPLSRRPWRRP